MRLRAMSNPLRGVVVMLILLAPTFSIAETAYVTDVLRLNLHAAADTSDRPFRVLESGQAFEVLSRDRLYAHVQLPDGVQGYVRAAYIVYDKPAKLIVAETQAESERLAGELEELRLSFAEPAAVIGSLEQEKATLSAELDETRSRITDLEEENAGHRDRAAQFKYSLPISWVGGATALCLIGGILLGLWWTDYRSRKRHGGIRIY